MRNAHEALFNSEKMLRNIFDNVQVGVELYDKEGCLVDINTKNLDIFGIAAKEDVLGINFFENPIVPEEIRRNVRNGQEQSFRLDSVSYTHLAFCFVWPRVPMCSDGWLPQPASRS